VPPAGMVVPCLPTACQAPKHLASPRARLKGVGNYASAARELVNVLGVDSARSLVTLLDQPDKVRADVFRQLHERRSHPALEDALLDLEADTVVRGWLTECLRLELGHAP
jgi:hypothetical protein